VSYYVYAHTLQGYCRCLALEGPSPSSVWLFSNVPFEGVMCYYFILLLWLRCIAWRNGVWVTPLGYFSFANERNLFLELRSVLLDTNLEY
jgi:hypothetical protein